MTGVASTTSQSRSPCSAFVQLPCCSSWIYGQDESVGTVSPVVGVAIEKVTDAEFHVLVSNFMIDALRTSGPDCTGDTLRVYHSLCLPVMSFVLSEQRISSVQHRYGWGLFSASSSTPAEGSEVSPTDFGRGFV